MTKENNPRQTFFTLLREWGTYAALLAQIGGPILVWLGWGIDEKLLRWLLYSGGLLPFFGIMWLRREYRFAKQRIEEDGKVQRPEWLWALVTGSITHKRQELPQEAPVMVLVPPSKHVEAGELDRVYNHNSKASASDTPTTNSHHNFLFHYIDQGPDGTIDENRGCSLPGGPVRSLATLSQELKHSAALVILDDCNWEKRYPQTMNTVRQWCMENTVRPVMAIRGVDGRGTLIYNWCSFEDLEGNDRALTTRLLAQAANRGTQWHNQAQLNRWIVLRLAILTLAIFLFCGFVSYLYWSRAVRLQERIDKLSQELLKAKPYELKGNLERTPGLIPAPNIIVMLFGVSKHGNKFGIEEVSATRRKPSIYFEADLNSQRTEGIVSCAIAKHIFVLWTGDSLGNPPRTANLQAWDLQGNSVGQYNSSTDRLDFPNGTWCTYQAEPSKDDERKRMLCLPASFVDNFEEPRGAVCVSTDDPNLLTNAWLRGNLLNFGKELSFSTGTSDVPVR
jgi:hypothetical protein